MIIISYSTALFVALKVSFAAHRNFIHAYLSNTMLSLDPSTLHAPFAHICQTSVVGFEALGPGLIFVTKSTKAWAFTAFLGTYLMS